jgi:hypothetical protein
MSGTLTWLVPALAACVLVVFNCHLALCNAASCVQLYGGLTNLMAVRQWVKAQIMQQCQGSLPRLKPDLPPQAWGVAYGGGRGGPGGGRGRGRGRGRKRRGDSSDEDEPEPEPESDSEPGGLV